MIVDIGRIRHWLAAAMIFCFGSHGGLFSLIMPFCMNKRREPSLKGRTNHLHHCPHICIKRNTRLQWCGLIAGESKRHAKLAIEEEALLHETNGGFLYVHFYCDLVSLCETPPLSRYMLTTTFLRSNWGSWWWYAHPVDPIKYPPLPSWLIRLRPAVFAAAGLQTPSIIVVSGKKKAVWSNFTT